MKRTTILCLLSVMTAASTSLLHASDLVKKDGGGTATDKKEAKVDTPDTLTDELIVQLNALADVLAAAKDKASAEQAVKKIDGIGGKFEAIAGRFDKLKTPSEEEKQRLEEKMDKATKAVQKKMTTNMPAIMGNQEVAAVIGPALMQFSKRMNKLDPVFERFGKKKKKKEGE